MHRRSQCWTAALPARIAPGEVARLVDERTSRAQVSAKSADLVRAGHDRDLHHRRRDVLGHDAIMTARMIAPDLLAAKLPASRDAARADGIAMRGTAAWANTLIMLIKIDQSRRARNSFAEA